MKRASTLALAALSLAYGPAALRAQPHPAQTQAVAARLRDSALRSDRAFELVEQLTTRFGPRPAGSPAERAAADWIAATLLADGFSSVRIERFPLKVWTRRAESCKVIWPSEQPLAVTMLGGSPSTPPGGVEGEIVRFSSLEALAAAAPEILQGRIVFLDYVMPAMQSGLGYALATAGRSQGPGLARRGGALAFVMRSAGTARDREPHTGLTAYQGAWAPLPSFALSPEDAEQLARLLALGPTRIRLEGSAVIRDGHSQNVIAEIPGATAGREIVLLGAHLDSWDLGTGAQDDAAGVGVVVAAAQLLRDTGIRPRRTVRLVLFGAEEPSQPEAPGGLYGAHDYARRNASAAGDHVIASESDLGSGRIFGLDLPPAAASSGFASEAASLLLPLGILVDPELPPHGGADMLPMQAAGVPVFLLKQDASRYFDVHHSAADTLGTVSAADLRQNVAAWAALIWLVANSEATFR